MNERGGVSSTIVDELSGLLASMGKRLATNQRSPVPMVSVEDLIDLPVEREVEAPPVVARPPGEDEPLDEEEEAACDEGVIELEDGVDVDDVEPAKPLSLAEARKYAERLLEFVSINEEHVKRAGPSNTRDYTRDTDVLVQTLAQMHVTSATKQVSLLNWARPMPRPIVLNSSSDEEDAAGA